MIKDKLQQYRKLKTELDSIKLGILQLDDDLRSPRTTQLGKISGGTQNAVTPVDIKLDEKDRLCALYRRKKEQLDLELWQIEQVIQRMPPQERTLLRLYFLQGKTWEQVAEEMGYSVAHVYRLRKNALCQLDNDDKTLTTWTQKQ